MAFNAEVMTPIELMIVKLMAEGFSSREIAERTTLTKAMVDDYRTGMLKKFGVKNSCHLIAHAFKTKIL